MNLHDRRLTCEFWTGCPGKRLAGSDQRPRPFLTRTVRFSCGENPAQRCRQRRLGTWLWRGILRNSSVRSSETATLSGIKVVVTALLDAPRLGV